MPPLAGDVLKRPGRGFASRLHIFLRHGRGMHRCFRGDFASSFACPLPRPSLAPRGGPGPEGQPSGPPGIFIGQMKAGAGCQGALLRRFSGGRGFGYRADLARDAARARSGNTCVKDSGIGSRNPFEIIRCLKAIRNLQMQHSNCGIWAALVDPAKGRE